MNTDALQQELFFIDIEDRTHPFNGEDYGIKRAHLISLYGAENSIYPDDLPNPIFLDA